MLLSIVIPAFKEEKWIENTIKQIKTALQEIDDKDFSSEIIVCDNNSTYKTAEIASHLGGIVVFEPNTRSQEREIKVQRKQKEIGFFSLIQIPILPLNLWQMYLS